MANGRSSDYDPADARRIEQLLQELRAAEDLNEKARVRSHLDELIFGLNTQD